MPAVASDLDLIAVRGSYRHPVGLPGPAALADAPRDLQRRPRLVIATPFSGRFDRTFSGTTGYLTNCGIETGFCEGGVILFDGDSYRGLDLRMLAAAWKLGRLLTRQPTGGFKFAPLASDLLWRRHMSKFRGMTLINTFQLYGGWFSRNRHRFDIKAAYYIDGTLTEYLEQYGAYDLSGVSGATMRAAIAVERRNMLDADAVVVMSERSRAVLVERYGVDADKVSVVPPAANMPTQLPAAVGPAADAPFTLCFVGLYPQRKGLDIIAAAVALLRSEGRDVRLRVIGNCPDAIARQDGVTFLGRIDKRAELDRFCRELAGAHFGMLMSRAEFSAIVTLEFLRLGTPVIATNVGGLTDILSPTEGGAILLPPESGATELAGVLRGQMDDPAAYAALRARAAQRAEWAAWPRAVAELGAALGRHGL